MCPHDCSTMEPAGSRGFHLHVAEACQEGCCWCLVQKHMKKGEFLFELIYPKEKDGQLPARSPSGRYRVKLFILVSTSQCDA